MRAMIAAPPPHHPLSSTNSSFVGATITSESSSTPLPLPKNKFPILSTSPIKPPPSGGSQRPPIDPIVSREQGSISGNKSFLSPEIERKSLPSNILTPNITSTLETRQIAPTSDVTYGEGLTSHNRNKSITITGGMTAAAGNQKVVPHRRYRSNNIPAISQIDSMPFSVAGSTMSVEQYNSSEALQKTHFVRVSFVIPVSERSLTSIKSSARTRVSLLRQVADLYNITAYDTVTVAQITRSREAFVQQSIAAEFLTVTFKDQFVSRGDMYTFQKSFLNSWVYEGKRLTFNGIRTNTKVIRHGDHVVRSGLITEDTKLTFRSRSARILWLVQMSSEMWEQACPYEAAGNQQTSQESSCKIYFDKFVEFTRRLFKKWKKLGLTHNLTVVFFSRTYIRHPEGERGNGRSSSVHMDSDGRMYEDHYKIVLENETTVEDNLIHRLKQEFVKYPKGVKWNLSLGNERTPSTASQGNVLEAINITLNLLQLHYIDRDLHRTGNSIVIITPGNGVFEIDKNLAGITKQRMMDNGIGSDMLSLGLPPLHVAPFFLYREKGASSAEEIQGFDDVQTYFELPHWMNLSFVDYDNDNDEGPLLYKENLNDGKCYQYFSAM